MQNLKVFSSNNFLTNFFGALLQHNSKIFPIRIIYQLEELIFYFCMSAQVIIGLTGRFWHEKCQKIFFLTLSKVVQKWL